MRKICLMKSLLLLWGLFFACVPLTLSADEGATDHSGIFFEAGTNIALIIPCPEMGLSYIRQFDHSGFDLQIGIIYPYAKMLIPYVGINYLYFGDDKGYAFGGGFQSRITTKKTYTLWSSKKKILWDVSPSLEWLRYLDNGDLWKMQYLFPLNLQLNYMIGF